MSRLAWLTGSASTAGSGIGCLIRVVSRCPVTRMKGRLVLAGEKVVYRLLAVIVDGYTPVLQGLAIDKEQIDRQVFNGDAAVAQRIYRLGEEVIDLQHTTSSLSDVLHALSALMLPGFITDIFGFLFLLPFTRPGFDKYGIPTHLQAHLQDVSDHLNRINSKVAEYRDAPFPDPRCQRDNRGSTPERGHEDLRLGGDPFCPHPSSPPSTA